MLYHRFWLRSLFVLALMGTYAVPSHAQIGLAKSTIVQDGKKKDGGDPPRPKPAPGPREGGDGD